MTYMYMYVICFCDTDPRAWICDGMYTISYHVRVLHASSMNLYSILHSLHPRPEERNVALISALSDILWKLGARQGRAIVALPPSHTQHCAQVPSRSYTPDHLTEKVDCDIHPSATGPCCQVTCWAITLLICFMCAVTIMCLYIQSVCIICIRSAWLRDNVGLHIHVYMYIYMSGMAGLSGPIMTAFFNVHVHTCTYTYMYMYMQWGWSLSNCLQTCTCTYVQMYIYHRWSCIAFQTTLLWGSSLSHMWSQ